MQPVALVAFLSAALGVAVQAEPVDNATLCQRGVDVILELEEPESSGEWPYEGVYRVKGEIPIGYRVGGAAICCMAIAMSDAADDPERISDAIERAVQFITSSVEHPLMSPDYDGGYDVRGWGYTYGALCLLTLEQHDLIPEGERENARAATAFFVNAIQQTEIPEIGGWNYARRPGRDVVSPPSSFMTAATVQTLFLAASLEHDVNEDVVTRALDAIEAAHIESGEFLYSGASGRTRPGGVPGAVGRMLICETTLHAAGRREVKDLRGAVDAFIAHWDELEKRRARHGTHAPPFGVAPYYFHFAHLYAAQAIELLPEKERQVYRGRLRELLLRTRNEQGAWNDRVFPRSASYGTAMSVLALRMPDIGPPTPWTPKPREQPADEED